jgi:DNA-directed RNA polymerase subunit P
MKSDVSARLRPLQKRTESEDMSYKCSRCKRDVELDEYGGVRCPFCGHRVLLKERSRDVKEVDVS